MSKILSQLLSRIKAVSITGATDKEISSIESDSRKITPGALFVAVPGVTVDGHKFIPDVVKAGRRLWYARRCPMCSTAM